MIQKDAVDKQGGKTALRQKDDGKREKETMSEIPNTTIIEITDYTAPELDVYARLNEVQLFRFREPQRGIFIAESPVVIERALDAGFAPVSFLMERKYVEGQGKELVARCPGVPVYTAGTEVLTKITGYKLTRGMLCAMNRKELPSVETVLNGAKRIAVLENVMNPANVGAIFRSAAALNMDAVLLTGGCSDPLYRRAIRVSMGTVFQIPWTYLEEENAGTDSGVRFLKMQGFRSVAMALREDSVTIDNPQLNAEEKLAVYLGTEGEGLSPETISACDYVARIPMSHGVDSLNVAAASAVAFWQMGNRR